MTPVVCSTCQRYSRPCAGLVVGMATLVLAVAARAQADVPARTAAEVLAQQWSRGKAVGTGPIRLATFPLARDDLERINPMGMMASGHTTPCDHLYLVAKPSTDAAKRYDVLAVAPGHVVSIQWRPNPAGGQPDPTVFDRAVDLKVVVEHAATCWSYVDHLVELAPAIQAQVASALKPGQPLAVRIPVEAGAVIGRVRGGVTFDFALVDTTVTRSGFVRPEQFLGRDPWKLHTVDPFDYLDEPLKGALLALNPRIAAPRGGQIDYDVDGRAVGNWYREGTGGYAGEARRLDYWVGHLTLAYHHVNPSAIIVSIGDAGGRPRQFAVRGNAPDPATIDVATGLVRYELVRPTVDNRTGRRMADDPAGSEGTLLVRLEEARVLVAELVLGRDAAGAAAFTEQARRYLR